MTALRTASGSASSRNWCCPGSTCVRPVGRVLRLASDAVGDRRHGLARTRVSGCGRALAFLIAVGIGVSAPPGAADEVESRSQVGVLGVDQFHAPRDRDSFSMVQFTPDPIERFNRASLAVTRPILHWVLRPLAKGWRFVSPEPVRRSVDRFGYNLAWPNRFVSLLLQGRPLDAGTETGRFLVNTTAGVAGFFDPATAWGMPNHDEDVGLSFASWGAGPGFYFFIPLIGPSSGRDALGRVFDTALNPASLVPGLSWLLNTNALSFRVEAYEALVASNRELYLPVRALWTLQRTVAVERAALNEADYARADPEPSLGLLLVRSDARFAARRTVRNIVTPATGGTLPYSAWIQPEPAPLVYIVPGIGTHRTSQLPVFLAQKAYERGYSVAVVSNPFHFEFIDNALSVPYPGYTPSDAEDLYAALSAIDRDLDATYPGRVASRRLLGYSLGAIESLFIAGEQDRRPADALRFERFVAVNPPVDLRYSARRFDGYFDAPLRWPEAEREQRVKRTGLKAYLMTQPVASTRGGFPFDRDESELLIGLYARFALIEALAAIEANGNAVLEIRPENDADGRAMEGVVNQTTLARYAAELIAPYYVNKTGLPPAELESRASLRAQEALLRESDRIHVLTNADDFILGDEQLGWLRQTVGSRLTVFPNGGHLGNLHVEAVQEELFRALEGPAR